MNTIKTTHGRVHSGLSKAALFILVLALSTVGSASAQNWTIGFAVGSSNLSDNDADLDFRSEVRGGYYFTPRFALEGQLTRATGILDSTMDTLMVNAIFELRPGQAFSPYLLAGAGAARVEDYHFLSTDPTVSSDGAAFQAAIGGRYYFGEERRMGVQVELSRLAENTDVFGFDGHTSLTAGMTWKLGR